MKSTIYSYLLILISIVFFSCESDDDNDTSTIDENIYGTEYFATIESRSDLNIYSQLLMKIEAKKQNGIQTLNFAPTDEAFQTYFNQIGISSIDDLSDAEVFKLDRLLKLSPYDPVSFRTYPYDSLPNDYYSVLENDGVSSVFDTLNADYSIYFEKVSETEARINYKIDCEVIPIESIRVSYDSSNSYLTLISRSALIITDQIPEPQTHFDIISENPDFLEFKKLITHAGMEDFYRNGINTLIIPSNDAFSAFYSELGLSGPNELDADTAKNYLRLHTLYGNSPFRNYPQGTSFINTFAQNSNGIYYQVILNNLANQNFKVYEAFNFNRQADIEKFNIVTINGNINIINTVLLFP